MDNLPDLSFRPESNSPVEVLARALIEASDAPYNNAAAIYTATGEKPDPRFGGNCLDKLAILRAGIPPEIQTTYIADTSKNPIHYAAIIIDNQTQWYCDPFLWQREPLPINNPHKISTLFRDYTIKMEPRDAEGTYSSIFLGKKGQQDITLITYTFNQHLSELPSPRSLIKRTDLPSFQIQFPLNEQVFLRVWYTKESSENPKKGSINDIWKYYNGMAQKISPQAPTAERNMVLELIEGRLNATIPELCNYFDEAHQREQTLRL